MAMMGRQLFQQVFQVATHLDDHGEVPEKAKVGKEKVEKPEAKPDHKMVDASKDSEVEKPEAKPDHKMVDASKDSEVEKPEAKPDHKMVDASKDSEAGKKASETPKMEAAPLGPASGRPRVKRAPTPFRIRAKLEMVNLVEVKDCQYVADLLTTHPPEEPVHARYTVISDDGVQAMGEQLISFSPEGEAQFRFTVKNAASGDLDLSIFTPCGTAKIQFHRYSQADRKAFKAAYGQASSSSSRSSNASSEGSRPRARAFDSKRVFRASAKYFLGIDIDCWEGMAKYASRKYFGCVPPCFSY